jgi:hypothetical protein
MYDTPSDVQRRGSNAPTTMKSDAFEVDPRVRIRRLGDLGSGVLSYGTAKVACADRTAGGEDVPGQTSALNCTAVVADESGYDGLQSSAQTRCRR